MLTQPVHRAKQHLHVVCLKPVDRTERGRGEHRIDGSQCRGELASPFNIHRGRLGTELGEERDAAVEVSDEPGGEVTDDSSNTERAGN